MKLIKPYYEIITPINGEAILKEIELAARTCYKSEGKIEYGKWTYKVNDGESKPFGEPNFIAKSARVLISKLIKLGHHAMLEFGGMITVKFICDRGVSHELVRHRLASFAQESTRYCNYGKDEHITFIIPSWTNIPECIITSSDDDLVEKDYYIEDVMLIRNLSYSATDFNWLDTMAICEQMYNENIKLGWQPQQARSVLPNSLKTEINLSANIREWRHIFTQRVAKTAHPQMRELMCPLLDEFKNKIPILFNDINY